MENSRFRSVFFENYYLLRNKKYLTDVKQHLNVSPAVAMATMTFQNGDIAALK